MHRWVGIIVLLCTFTSAAWAVPASREPIMRILADGSRDTVYLHGDEYGSYRTDTRGRVIMDGKVVKNTAPSIARAPQKQMISSYVPSKGKVRIPVLLVNFTDLSFTISDPVEQFDDLFNGKGGSNPHATGSVHDYYIASSDSALDLQYDVYGPFNLSHPMEYYGANKTNSNGTVSNHNIRAKDLVTEAAQLAADNGVDFTLYDNNNDGTVDNVSIIVAGYNEAEGGPEASIWPHYSVISNSGQYKGKYLSGYLMISEYRSSGGKVQAGIGTYCHEFGHALGLPDLYDTSSEKNYTVGSWDIMCNGSYNNDGSTPPTYTAFERFMMGWMQPTVVTSAGMRTLQPIESHNEALLIAASEHNLNAFSPNPTEYFLLENRQAIGWDAGKEALVATGLLVSHITFDKKKWDNNIFNNSKPLGFAIVSAGMSNPTQSTAADIFPGTTKRTSWMPTLNDGTLLNQLNVNQIRQRSDLCISMQIGNDGAASLSFREESAQMETSYMYSPVHYDTAHIHLDIDHLSVSPVRVSVSTDFFRFSCDSGATWHSAKDTVNIDVETDSTYTIPVEVIHAPQRKNCSYIYAFLTAETFDESEGAQMTLSGRAPRPTLITTPEVDSVTNVTPITFCLYWTPQEDADGYYYTLYTISEGESEEPDSLDVAFTQTGQSAQTARTLYAPSQISMRFDNTYTPNSTDNVIGGEVLIYGSADGTTWDKVTSIPIQRTTKNVVRTFDLDTAKHWRQFRLEYIHKGGFGGTTIQEWVSHFNMKIDYIYPLHKYMVYAPGGELIFRELTPNTTYYYAMQAYEEKGCEPHYSELSTPLAIQTKAVPDELKLIVSRQDDGQYIVELPEMSDGLHTLGIFDYSGHLVYQIKPAYGTSTITLPALRHEQLYLIKYFHNRMGRKDMSTKFLSY